MGYIKKEEAIEALYRYGFVTKDIIEKNIRALPSIDIVRCKECRYWRTRDDETKCCVREYATDHWCDDDFCSYGEREGE